MIRMVNFVNFISCRLSFELDKAFGFELIRAFPKYGFDIHLVIHQNGDTQSYNFIHWECIQFRTGHIE